MTAAPRTPDLDEATLRARCARVAGDLPAQPAIRRIAFVGALQCTIGARDMDSVRMTHALDYLLRSDVVVSPNFEIDVINLYHGRDFLAEETTTDLLFVSFVPNVEHRLFARLEPSVLEAQRDALATGGAARDPSFFWQARSQQHSVELWRQRAVATGARLILTVGGRKEISTQVLATGSYQTLVPTPLYECQPPYRSWSREQLYEGVAWDVPYRWLGVLAHVEALRTRPDSASRPPRTMLSREMLARDGARSAPSDTAPIAPS
jgi:hypothetical protein